MTNQSTLKRSVIDIYLSKHAYRSPQIQEPPAKDLQLIVVIPAVNEPDIVSTLDSLWACSMPPCNIEIIVHVNSSEKASKSVKEQNLATIDQIIEWTSLHNNPKIKIHVIHSPDLPDKFAGSGLARKIGMDEAVHRFNILDLPNGIIVSLDADCLVEKNYLVSIFNTFTMDESTNACSIYFEHPLEGPADPFLYEGITQYELYLRYYHNGLRYAGYPFHFYTVGSSMAHTASIYCEQGGMNKKKAGEDFYFLHKFMPLGSYYELNTTTVYPATRSSSRVPFGTGGSMVKWMKDRPSFLPAPNPNTFKDLQQLFVALPKTYKQESDQIENVLNNLSKAMVEFISEIDMLGALKEIVENSANGKSYMKRFYRWFNGLAVLKFSHFAAEHYYKQMPVKDAAIDLLKLMDQPVEKNMTAKDLLLKYRLMDKSRVPA